MYKQIKNDINVVTTAVKKIENGVVTNIPPNPDNTDYQAYLKWVAEGNTPEPADQGAE